MQMCRCEDNRLKADDAIVLLLFLIIIISSSSSSSSISSGCLYIHCTSPMNSVRPWFAMDLNNEHFDH